MSTLVNETDAATGNSAGNPVFAMPAVPLQTRLWRLSHAGVDAAWNVAVRFRLSGPLHRERMEQALRLLIDRHEALRSALQWNGDAVVQKIVSWAVLPVDWCDLRDIPATAQAAEVERLSLDHARQPFLLDQAPLFRVRVLRVAEEEHVLLWNAHHAICDGWSVGLMAHDWMQCYGKLAEGRIPDSENSLDFGDYAVWLESARHSPEYEEHRRFWKRELRSWKNAGLPQHWRSSESSEATAAIQSVLLPRQLTDRIATLAQRHESTFFHAVLAAFSVWMRTQQSGPQVVMGTPVSGRDQGELENIVGTFVNYVPLRFQVNGEIPFAKFLHAVRDSASEALDHAEFRLEDMLALQHSSDGADERSLFSVAFICQQDFVRPISAAGVTLTAMPSVSAGALRPLTVFLVERADGWRLSCEVDNRSVSVVAGKSLLRDFKLLLEEIAVHSEETVALLASRAGCPLPRLSMVENSRTRIPATEFQKRLWLLSAINPEDSGAQLRIRLEMNGPLDVDALRTALHQLVQRHESLRTTFEEQDGQLWQVIHPQAAINFQVSETRSATTSALQMKEMPFSLANGPLLRTHLFLLEGNHHRLEITLSHAIADGWAAGLFLQQLQELYEAQLSGTQQIIGPAEFQFADYAEAEQAMLAAPEKDRRLQWWKKYLVGNWKPLALPHDLQRSQKGDALGHGASAGLERALLSPETVAAVKKFTRDRHTTLFAVFGAVFQALLMQYSGQNDVLFTTPHANRSEENETILGRLADPVCLTGHADETTTFETLLEQFSRQSLDAMENALPLSILMPLVNMQVTDIYHPLNQVVFFYQRAFVHNMEWKNIHVQPLPDTPSVTGSEWQLGVVEREDGIALEFVYDTTLYSQTAMQNVVRNLIGALERALANPEKSLSEVVELNRGEIISLVQPVVTAIAKKPANATHVPAQVSLNGAATYEREIQKIWQQIFSMEILTPDANFFHLGGHSLLLAMLQIELKKKFNVQLTAADIFRNPTIAAQAEWVRTQLDAKTENADAKAWMQNSRIVPIQPGNESRPLFVISQSMIFRTFATELGAAQPVYAVQMLEQDEASLASMSYDDLMNFYLDLIRQVQPTGPYRIAGWCVSGWIAYGVARQLELLGEEVEMLIVVDACAPEHWERMPWIRRKFLRAIYSLQRSRWIGKHVEPLQAGDKPVTGAALLLRKLQARLRKAPLTPAELEEQRRNALLHCTAGKAADRGALRGNILVFCSEQEPLGPFLDPDMGWSEFLNRPVSVEVLPGDHRQIFELPGARIMAQSAQKLLGIQSTTSQPVRGRKIDATALPSTVHPPMVGA